MKFAVAFVVLALIGAINCGYPHVEGLTDIAQGSANQAHSAVASQYAAAQRASYAAKSSLAQQAAQAAATAQAALAGKHVLLQNLEQQKARAQANLHEELSQLQSAEKLAAASSATAHAAAKQAAIIRGAAENAEALARQADNAAHNAAQALASQNAMAAAAKANLNEIEHRVEATRADYLATKEATQKAVDFAQKAQQNAAAAGSHSIEGPDGGKPAIPFGHDVQTYFH
ncbi:unnamed protein product [Hermetia illucens]|uniref:Uncharacterized protein n=1 Tax=Hermetia illucens TaxID=343691 RepID=A0A7R8V3N3_HERIL|nr:translation initiation factor IF-2-like [Hermetia illucens]CAD7092183.1 unnamed protein product [Hermetia illucens]